MAEPIPDKGRVLTAMTCFWFEEMADVVPGTLLAADPVEISAALGGAGAAARVGGPGRAGPPGRDAPPRVHRAGVPGRLGLGGVRALGHGARHGDARGAAAGQQAGEADLHPLHQGGRGARRQHRHGRGRRPGGRRVGPGGAGRLPRAVPAGGGPGGRGRLHPGRHQVRAGLRRRGALPVRRGVHAGLLAAVAGGRRWCPGRRRPPSTSSPCATGWRRSPGTARRPRPRCRPRSRTAMSQRYIAAYERVTGRSLGDWYGATT